MKRALALAYSRGVFVGAGMAGALVDCLYAVAAARAGDVVFAIVAFWVAVALAWMVRREWRAHQRGLTAFEP